MANNYDEDQEAIKNFLLREKELREEDILAREGYVKRSDGLYSKIETQAERRAKLEEEVLKKLKENTSEEDRVWAKVKLTNAKREELYSKELKSINDVIKGSIEITDAQKENLAKLKQSNEYIAARQASEFKKQAEALGAVVLSNGKLLEVNGKIITDSIKLSNDQKKQLDVLRAGGAGKHFGEMSEKYKDTNNILTAVSGNLKELAGSSIAATAGLQLAGAIFEGSIKALTSFTSSIYKGERGATVTANALNELTKTIGDTVTGIGTAFAIFSFFMPGGVLVKGLKIVGGLLGALGGQLIKGYGEFQKLGAEQNDKLFASYNKLAASGLGAANGLEGVIDSVHTLNMSVSEMEKFNELLTNNSKELKLLGSTAGDGAKNFAKVAGELSKSQIGEQLERLGVTADEQREHTLRYMANQTRMGLAQGKTQQELIRGSQQYIEELDKIAMLTGANRKEQEEARAAVMAEEELRAAQLQAELSGDKKRQEYLAKMADYATYLRASGDIRGSTGATRFAAGRGPTDETSAAFMQTYGNASKAALEGKNIGEIIKEGQLQANQQLKQFAGVKAVGGDVSPLITGKIGNMIDTSKKNETVLKAVGEKGNIDDYIKELQKQRKEGDDRLQATVAGNRMQQAAGQIMDKAVFGFNDAAKIHAAATTKFKEAVDTFSKVVGAKQVAGGTNQNAPNAPPNAPPNAGATQMGGMAEQRRQGLGGASRGIPSTPVPPTPVPPTPVPPTPVPPTPVPPTPVPTTRGLNVSANTPDDVMKLIKFQGDSLGNREHFDKLDPYVKQNFMDMISEYGKPVQINAAMRSGSEQQDLYDKWIENGKLGNPVAKPGYSQHNFGRALDLNSGQVTELASSGLLSKYGFSTIDKDPPHIQMARFGGVFSGPESGYPVMLHGDQETVVTKPQFDDMAEGVKKESVTTAMQNLGSTSTNSVDSPTDILKDLFSMMEDKFDSMIDKLSDANDISADLLKHSRV